MWYGLSITFFSPKSNRIKCRIILLTQLEKSDFVKKMFTIKPPITPYWAIHKVCSHVMAVGWQMEGKYIALFNSNNIIFSYNGPA